MALKYTVTDKQGNFVCSFVEAPLDQSFLAMVAAAATEPAKKKKANAKKKAVADAQKTGGK